MRYAFKVDVARWRSLRFRLVTKDALSSLLWLTTISLWSVSSFLAEWLTCAVAAGVRLMHGTACVCRGCCAAGVSLRLSFVMGRLVAWVARWTGFCLLVCSLFSSCSRAPSSFRLIDLFASRLDQVLFCGSMLEGPCLSRFHLRAVPSFATHRPLRPSLLHVLCTLTYFGYRSHSHFSSPHLLLFISSSYFCVDITFFRAHLADPRYVYDMCCWLLQPMSIDVPWSLGAVFRRWLE